MVITGYPALCIDDQGMLSIDVLDDAATAEQLHHSGMQGLIMKSLPDQSRYLRKQLPDLQQQCLYYLKTGSCQELHDDLIAASLDQCFLNTGSLPRKKDEFEQILEKGSKTLAETASRFCQINLKSLEIYHQCELALQQHSSSLPAEMAEDIHQQLQNLVYPGYLQHTGLTRLRHYPRYLKGIIVRLQKYDNNPGKDSQGSKVLMPFMKKYLEAVENWYELTLQQQEKL